MIVTDKQDIWKLIDEFYYDYQNPNLTITKAIRVQGLIGYKDQLEDAIEYTFTISKLKDSTIE